MDDDDHRARSITSAGSTIFNTATVTGNIKNKGVTSTDSEITTVRPGVDLTITKADSPDPVCAARGRDDGRWRIEAGSCQTAELAAPSASAG